MRIQTDKAHNWDGERVTVSFRCDKSTWFELDQYCTEHYGNYKKSILIESLIQKYLKHKKNSNIENLV